MCASLKLNKKKREGGIGGDGAAPPPQSRLETPIFTCKVLGPRLNVILKVYTARHAPWKPVECRLRHNDAQ